MPREGFESTIPVFEKAETVHALDRAATVIGTFHNCLSLSSKYSPKHPHPNGLGWLRTGY
jgi:hypothetical protein